MEYYWAALILSVITCFIKSPKLSRILCVLCVLYMCAISGLRDVSVGTDSLRYSEYFYDIYPSKNSEYIFALLIKICQSVFSSYVGFFAVISILTYSLLLFVSQKYCDDCLKYSVLLFIISNSVYFIDSFNAVRQLLAIFVLLSAYSFLEQKKEIPFWILYIIAVGIHNTSLLLLPFILLSRIRLNKAIVTIAVPIMFCFSIALSTSGFGEGYFSMLSSLSFFDLKNYAVYFTTAENYSGGYSVVGLFVLLFFPCIACVLSYRILDGHIFTRLYFWGIVLLCLLSPFTLISARACAGLTACELLVVPMAIRRAKLGEKILLYSYLAIFTGWFIYNLVSQYSLPDQLGPYLFSTDIF